MIKCYCHVKWRKLCSYLSELRVIAVTVRYLTLTSKFSTLTSTDAFVAIHHIALILIYIYCIYRSHTEDMK